MCIVLVRQFVFQLLLFIDLQSLGPNSVSSQGNTLKHLVLSKNKLSEVPSRAIKHLKNLEHLNLNENEITALRDEAFLGLSKVSEIDSKRFLIFSVSLELRVLQKS